MRPISFNLNDSFWSPRLESLKTVTLPEQWSAMESTGRIDNIRRAAGRIEGEHKGFVFNDSDVYKWLEAAARAGYEEEGVDELVELILESQDDDGYLNTAYMFDDAAQRWSDIRDKHELYCAGHFIEAALALAENGDERLVAAARKLADLVCSTFGPEEEGKRPVVPGHEEIEIALIALYRATGENRYLEQARYFLDARGRGLIGGLAYHQDHKPFREMEKMEGHAVRALYLNVAAADLFLETGDAALLETLERLWERLYTRQIYVTGGPGARHSGESFGDDYELPNAGAYSETCASVASIFWNRRMLAITGEARYADAIETALYNAALAGISLKGDGYFYTNPLSSEGEHRRAFYFSCACCPPNIARLLAALPDYFVSVRGGAVCLDQYAAGDVRVEVEGQDVRLRVETEYPWDGAVRIVVEVGGSFPLRLRIPGWAAEASAAVNGEPLPVDGSGYLSIDREWAAGDVITLDFPLPVRQLVSHPAVVENTGRVALARGPLVYCVESADPHPEHLRIAKDAEFQPVDREGLLGLAFHAEVDPPGEAWDRSLYLPRESDCHPKGDSHFVTITAIPYFAWANGEPQPMRVWLRVK